MDTATVASFEASRNRLASLAYRLLGSAADAEDTVQDAFLRWQAADRGYVEVPEAWLTKVVTNLALDRLRSATTRRERAVGAWMPEPLLDGDPMLGPADTVEQRESVTLAVLMLMERLSPIERAVYVLREAFSYSHAETAEILDITESASQQYLHRARRRIAAAGTTTETDRATARRIVEAFVAAASSGRTEQLVALLTDDATGISDGAGLGWAAKFIRYATPQRIAGAVRAGFKPTPAKRKLAGGSPAIHAAVVNACPAMLATLDDRVVGVLILEVRDDKIAGVRGIAARQRLGRLTEEWQRQEHDVPLIESW
ncbi:RNA polymerase subunit sigma-70 [Nocardia sp. 852002-20019_SCH5090214]|uniref:RNA polymerase subunit sigma-70 n=1 Tax=Nocardia nova TaxID=37330 RepID=A0A2S5ZZH8_9NOCA|nr:MULTISPECIES: sigma-70 family RNA polymerase sigma factor [Nocardia]OBF70705.1 RNA polymerase subunit sigma-70 [Mycobacterium sp. 852002-51759_SCH5129042]MBF6278191.1 sigma-70 family RNA polymerase sigma factor [Nocardia nova]OBA44776.1 RNA polymerase subunit sigma-70 [Nocardia sp. 852002-51101_SCH5132738]OBA67558.1 RNA polymerase subunit sigma-70 [Nocardia sp. 852002-20019_SCH5090214]OBB39597.1 RNA polymerase subunit sigma-70 [Nocardia sp. 852002-51244_SCH5132740]